MSMENLNALNSLISIGIGVNLVYALFDNLGKKILSSVDNSIEKLITDIQDTIQNHSTGSSDTIKKNLNEYNVNVIEIKNDFLKKSNEYTRQAENYAFFAVAILFAQLFFISTYSIEVSHFVYIAMAHLDVIIIMAPVTFCLIINHRHCTSCKPKLIEIQTEVKGFNKINGSEVIKHDDVQIKQETPVEAKD